MDHQEAFALLDRIYAAANAYLDVHGRHAHHVPATITPEQLRALADRGLAPNTFRTFTHDEAVTRLRALAATVDERTAADAFVAGLGSAPPRRRGLLPALALAGAMPAHPYPAGRRTCDVCFVDATATVDTTGSWRLREHDSPLPGDVCAYVLVLEDVTPPVPVPEPHDVWTLHEILDVLRALPPATRPGQAAQALRARDLLPGGRRLGAYTSLLEDLAFLGILQTPSHPGMLTRFTTARQRDERPSVRVEVSAPLSFWTAGHGITEPLVDRLFGHLDRPTAPPRPPSAPPRRPAARTVRAAPLPRELRGEPRGGDVYAIGCREDAWVLCYCHRVEERSGRPYGLVEFLDGVFPRLPTADDIDGRRFQPRYDGPWRQWTSHLDKTPRVRRLARDVPRPDADRPPAGGVAYDNARNLGHYARSCFPELQT
ncbi:hypothetical protein [Actinoplanes xinjiangensis]|uniref:hypothetical protein n=1 Tax=Actinoplanes xinjiangensis TaxID=512350 RepID=UPI00341AFE7A